MIVYLNFRGRVLGCIDAAAVNYDDTAACDDGSCIYAGCTYEFACNYNPEATIDDASCEFGTCPGCTDPAACNFNPTVSEDDGSCSYGCGCTDPWACNFDPSAMEDDGSCEYALVQGCTDSMALNYDSSAVIDDGSCQYIEGCMNPNAANYDSTAGQLPNGLIIPGGSCNLNVWGQNYFGIDSADYWSDPSLWVVGARIYVGANQQQWFVDGISPVQTNCNAPAVLINCDPKDPADVVNTGC